MQGSDRHQLWVAPGKDTNICCQPTVASLQFQGSRWSLNPYQPPSGKQYVPSMFTIHTLQEGMRILQTTTLNRPRFDPENTLTGALSMVL